jgi:hypothetical protein
MDIRSRTESAIIEFLPAGPAQMTHRRRSIKYSGVREFLDNTQKIIRAYNKIIVPFSFIHFHCYEYYCNSRKRYLRCFKGSRVFNVARFSPCLEVSLLDFQHHPYNFFFLFFDHREFIGELRYTINFF